MSQNPAPRLTKEGRAAGEQGAGEPSERTQNFSSLRKKVERCSEWVFFFFLPPPAPSFFPRLPSPFFLLKVFFFLPEFDRMADSTSVSINFFFLLFLI